MSKGDFLGALAIAVILTFMGCFLTIDYYRSQRCEDAGGVYNNGVCLDPKVVIKPLAH